MLRLAARDGRRVADDCCETWPESQLRYAKGRRAGHADIGRIERGPVRCGLGWAGDACGGGSRDRDGRVKGVFSLYYVRSTEQWEDEIRVWLLVEWRFYAGRLGYEGKTKGAAVEWIVC